MKRRQKIQKDLKLLWDSSFKCRQIMLKKWSSSEKILWKTSRKRKM